MALFFLWLGFSAPCVSLLVTHIYQLPQRSITMTLLGVASQESIPPHENQKSTYLAQSWFVLGVQQQRGVGRPPSPLYTLFLSSAMGPPRSITIPAETSPTGAWTLVHTHVQDEPTGYLLVRGKGREGPSHPFFPSIKCRGHYVVATLTPL